MTARGSRYEAQQKGELIYWTGKPCKRGHIDFRRADNGNCCECDRDVQRGRSKIRYDADPAKAIASSIKYRADHLAEVQTRLRGWAAKKNQTDPQWRLRRQAGRLASYALRYGGRRRRLIGCTGDEYRLWLEAQFKPGMTWENYGSVWNIDHIKPLTSFDMTDPKQFYAACHYTNTRPMFWLENLTRRHTEKQPIKRPIYKLK